MIASADDASVHPPSRALTVIARRSFPAQARRAWRLALGLPFVAFAASLLAGLHEEQAARAAGGVAVVSVVAAIACSRERRLRGSLREDPFGHTLWYDGDASGVYVRTLGVAERWYVPAFLSAPPGLGLALRSGERIVLEGVPEAVARALCAEIDPFPAGLRLEVRELRDESLASSFGRVALSALAGAPLGAVVVGGALWGLSVGLFVVVEALGLTVRPRYRDDAQGLALVLGALAGFLGAMRALRGVTLVVEGTGLTVRGRLRDRTFRWDELRAVEHDGAMLRLVRRDGSVERVMIWHGSDGDDAPKPSNAELARAFLELVRPFYAPPPAPQVVPRVDAAQPVTRGAAPGDVTPGDDGLDGVDADHEFAELKHSAEFEEHMRLERVRAAPLRFHLVDGNGRARTWFVHPGEVLAVGRGERADVRWDDPSLAPTHALLGWTDGPWIRPEGGACVLGRKGSRVLCDPAPTPLSDGDELQLGALVLRAQLPSGSTRADDWTDAFGEITRLAEPFLRARGTMAEPRSLAEVELSRLLGGVSDRQGDRSIVLADLPLWTRIIGPDGSDLEVRLRAATPQLGGRELVELEFAMGAPSTSDPPRWIASRIASRLGRVVKSSPRWRVAELFTEADLREWEGYMRRGATRFAHPVTASEEPDPQEPPRPHYAPHRTPVERGLVVLRMVAAVHRMGFERLYVEFDSASSSPHWSCALHVDPYGDHAPPPLRYSTEDGERFFGWEDAAFAGPQALAATFVERFAGHLACARGADPVNAEAVRGLVGEAETRGLPALADDANETDMERAARLVVWGRAELGELDRMAPPSLATRRRYRAVFNSAAPWTS